MSPVAKNQPKGNQVVKAKPAPAPKEEPMTEARRKEPMSDDEIKARIDAMSDDEIKARVDAYKNSQLERLQRRLEAQVAKFATQLKDKKSSQFEIIVRQAKLAEIKDRVSELRRTAKKLRGEIKALKVASKAPKEKAKKAS